jgi:threonine dehydrogenase-like Zn-dependent dehydrogenase
MVESPRFEFREDKLVLKEITLESALSSSWSAFDHAISLIASNADDLKALCTHSYPIDQAETALKALGREITDGREAIHVYIDCHA